jgi:hypothetical protein
MKLLIIKTSGLDEHRVVHLKKWIGYVEVLTALFICGGCAIPYFFQYEVVNDTFENKTIIEVRNQMKKCFDLLAN